MAFAPAIGATTSSRESKIFPFPYSVDDLSNGLRVVTVPTPYPDLVAFWAVVRTGSRNEVEPGKTGFAHFFEHMMFRGTEEVPAREVQRDPEAHGSRPERLHHSDDLTRNYHTHLRQGGPGEGPGAGGGPVPAPRRTAMEGFRTEAKAVLGEYNKNSANPVSKLLEVHPRERPSTKHTYKHTTMGFLKDIEDMPNQFAYSKTFFDRFYRPERMSCFWSWGDVEPENGPHASREVLGRLETRQPLPGRSRSSRSPDGPYYGTRRLAAGDPSVGLRWPYRGPAFSDDRSPTWRPWTWRRRSPSLRAHRCTRSWSSTSRRWTRCSRSSATDRDPGLLIIGARVKEPGDVEYVQGTRYWPSVARACVRSGGLRAAPGRCHQVQPEVRSFARTPGQHRRPLPRCPGGLPRSHRCDPESSTRIYASVRQSASLRSRIQSSQRYTPTRA